MYSKFQLAKKYLQHYFTASNSKGHGIHSPFVFDFIKNVLNDKRDFYAYSDVEKLRKKLLDDESKIAIKDFGAGSALPQSKNFSVADIAKRSAVTPKRGQLLFRIANYYRPQTMLELGTSLGISASYLSLGNTDSKMITIEGSPEIAVCAQKNLDSLSLENVKLIHGNFDDELPSVIAHHSPFDLVYVDGNHRKEPVLKYLNMLMNHMSSLSVIIFDDIHWSKEMEEAWLEIYNDPRLLMTIDLFFFGLVFFREDFRRKQHFAIRYPL